MTPKQKRSLYKIIAAAVLFAAGLAAEQLLEGTVGTVTSLLLFASAYVLVGLKVLIDAVKGVLRGELLDENFLMAIATVGAVVIGEYDEGVAVMLFYQVGELFQSCAVSRSRESITELMNLRADYADVERGGELVRVDPEEVEVGEIIVVRPGEKLPLDGVIVDGATSVNTAALTGESLPRTLHEGDEVLSGCINGEGLIRVRAAKPAGESTAARILELVESSSARKSRSEAFITRFARVYTPLVVAAALLIALLPPLIFGRDTLQKWIFQGLTFLVISCPCALVISVPLAFFGGIGAASKNGVLVKGGNYLEALAELETVVFDKTGTLTRGSFKVEQLRPADGCDADTLLRLAAMCETSSSHPIARSILDEHRARFGDEPNVSGLSHVTELAGGGVTCVIDGETVAVGGRRLMKALGVECETPASAGTVVHVAATRGQSSGGTTTSRWLGCMIIADEVKPSSAAAIARLRELGVSRMVMLTGDSKPVAAAVAAAVGVDEYEAELLPAGKVDAVERLLEGERRMLAFVGDGLNDAPVLSRADVGIAMGGIGSDAAIEAADVVLMDDDPQKIASAVAIARRTIRIARQNIVFALTVKAAIMALGVLGRANMWLAVFADVGVSVLAILNSMRCLSVGKS